MSIDEIKFFCLESEIPMVNAMYKWGIKQAKDNFDIVFTGRDECTYLQTFDKNGIPVKGIVPYRDDLTELQ